MEINRARAELRRRNLSCLSPFWQKYLGQLGCPVGPLIGDHVKSWDVLKTADFLEHQFSHASRILDIGAYASEVLYILRKLGFSDLTGVDLNPDLKKMPHRDSIQYVISNFTQTPFADASFDVITAISVIEHGFQSKALLGEISRLLKPGGQFIASFDYWPNKISTDGITMFNLPWTIFSREEVENFVKEAQDYGLIGPKEMANSLGDERPIECANRRYTFAWISMRKSP